MNLKNWFPFLRWYPQITRTTLQADLVAGIVGAIVILPQGVAFATIAGMPPQYGLYAGMIPAIIAALFGSSWHLVSGPTTAASVVLFSVLSPLAEPGSASYVQLALTLTLMVGVFQLMMGFARMGAVINMISHSVIVGFTAGAALLIVVSQLKNFFGIDIDRGGRAYTVVWNLITNLDATNWYAVIVALVTLVSAIISKWKIPKIPYMLVALTVGSIVGWLINTFSGQDHQVISTVASVSATLPPLSAPLFDFDTLSTLAPAAVAITLLVLTEAVSISRSISLKSGQNIDASQEFIGQGLSNIVGSFFSSYVATGSFNRSAMNYAAGAKTPVAAIIAGGLLLVLVVLIAPLIGYLPHAVMAGLLFVVGWGLIDFYHIGKILKTSRADSAVLAITFISTLTIGLEFAIVFGIVMGLFLFLMNSMRPNIYSRIPGQTSKGRKFVTPANNEECLQLKIVRIDGSIYFGSLYYIKKILNIFHKREPEQNSLLILSQSVNQVDISGAEFLSEEAQHRRDQGGKLYFYKVKDRFKELLRRGGYLEDIGEHNFFETKKEALSTIVSELDQSICARCDRRIFEECKNLPSPKNQNR